MEFENQDCLTPWYERIKISNKRFLLCFIIYFTLCNYIFPSFFYSLLLDFGINELRANNIVQLIAELIGVIFIGFILKDYLIDESKEASKHSFSIFIRGARWYIPSQLTQMLISLLLILFFNLENSTNQEGILELVSDSTCLIFLSAVIIAPILEELLFRGLIFKSLRKHGFWISAFVSSFFFGLLHVLVDISSGNWVGTVYIVVYGAMGMFMCKAYEDTHNLWGSIALHFVNNLVGMVVTVLL